MFFRGEKIVYVSTTSNTEISLKYLKKKPCLLFYILQNLYVRIETYIPLASHMIFKDMAKTLTKCHCACIGEERRVVYHYQIFAHINNIG